MRSKIIASAISLMSLTAVAAPSINVGSLNEYIQSGQSTLGKRINNTGSSTAFVRVTVDEIVFNGRSYKENPLNTDMLIKGQGDGLISSPARLIIPAKGQQTNRLVFTGERDKERYYRVRYIPVIPEDTKEFGLSSDELKKYESDISAGVTVLTGFGTIVTVLPKDVKFNTRITDNNNKLVISNNGNASIVVSSLKECSSNLTNCSQSMTQQLRPGMTLERVIQNGKVWQYSLQEGTGKKTMISGKK